MEEAISIQNLHPSPHFKIVLAHMETTFIRICRECDEQIKFLDGGCTDYTEVESPGDVTIPDDWDETDSENSLYVAPQVVEQFGDAEGPSSFAAVVVRDINFTERG